MKKIAYIIFLLFLVGGIKASAQQITEYPDCVNICSNYYSITLHINTGTIDFEYPVGTFLKNTVAVFKEKRLGNYTSTVFKHHAVKKAKDKDSLGDLINIFFIHSSANKPLRLVQELTFYKDQPYVLIRVSAEATSGGNNLESNYISPLAILPEAGGISFTAGEMPRLLDVPFDNDDWVKMLTVDLEGTGKLSGTGYEFVSLYDYHRLSGLVAGSISHDFWKTGISYATASSKGYLDSLVIYGGASTPDNPNAPKELNGYDGTHDVVPHGTMLGHHIRSPVIFLSASLHREDAFQQYGNIIAATAGSLQWKQNAPVYWNSFGVEGVLGHEKVMMPEGVRQISDFIASLKNFSRYTQPVLSIDSYSQDIYTTNVLRSIGDYAKNNGQQLGFYFIPFAVWTWKSGIETDQLRGTDAYIRDVTLKDSNGKTIIYKDGEFGAYPLDPTHPATRQRIINELLKAKAINAKFLKIDFLSAGALESSVRYDQSVRSGMQAYGMGMKMLKHLIDSILGEDIFITQAISPMFPSQYTHMRFLSTDIYSHLRNDQPGFPHYGSTASSMITSSHLGWTQGTLWPFTNMDVSVMQHFQRHPDISEKEVKVRLISMMVMGSVLGDGSDYRQDIAKERASKYLNNKSLCNFFKAPRAFIPLQVADGLTEDQQLSFYLPGDTLYASLINFSKNEPMQFTFLKEKLKWENRDYDILDFFTNEIMGTIKAGQDRFDLTVAPKDAIVVKFVKQ